MQPCFFPHWMYHVPLITCMYVCREGIFVRVLGHIRTFSQQRSVVGFLIQPLKDFNEITYHMVHVVHSQLALQKGAPVVRGGEGRGGEGGEGNGGEGGKGREERGRRCRLDN